MKQNINKNSCLFILFFCFIFLFDNVAFAQIQKQTPVYTTLTTNVGGYYESLPVDYISNPGKKYPLLIFIHGKGELGDGSAAQLPRVLVNGPAKLINQGKFPSSFTVRGEKFSFIVISPQFSTNSYTTSADNINSIINYCKQNYRVDDDRIYVTGLSMGGGFAWRFIGKYPEVIAAGLTVCGSSSVNKEDVDRIVAASLPIWATHNSGDPTVSSNVTKKWINTINAHIPAPDPAAIMTIFESNSHDAWSKTYDPNFKENGLNVYEWMLSHKRGGATPLPPVANAGMNQTITLPVNSVTLDGTKSTAPEGSISSYTWTKVSGPAAGVISSPGSSKTTVNNLSEGTYQFQLKITDNKGGVATAVLTIKVEPAPLPPVANAGNAQIITLPLSTVTLDGTKSSAPSGSITSFQWSKISGPSSGTIVNSTSSVSSVTGLKEGVYVFQLKVTDSKGGSSTATVSITVNAQPIPPIANAGNDQTIDLPQKSVSLDGSNSTAPAGSITAYKWSKLSGPSGGDIINSSAVSTVIDNLTAGVYQFELKVTDNNGASSSAIVTVTVNNAAIPPIANAGAAKTIILPNNMVTLDGSGSSAPDDTIKKYIWRKVSGPLNENISDPDKAVTIVSGLIEGVYVFELEVISGKGLSSTSTVLVTVKAAPLPPIADAGSSQTITLPINSISLNGSSSIAPSGVITGYEWSKVSGPTDAVITSPNYAITSITDLTEGVYIFELKVTDNNGANSTSLVTVVVKAALLPPVANAGANKIITLPVNSVSLDGSLSTAPSGTISKYEWNELSGPSGAIIESPFNTITDITNLAEGIYAFELRVTDDNGLSSTALVSITVKAAILPPIAEAGADITITLPENTATLDGSASTAPSGTIISYKWSNLSGPSGGDIFDSNHSITLIDNLTEGVYQFELKVTDNNGLSSASIITVTVCNVVLPPIAIAGDPQTITFPANTVSLDGSASQAPSGSISSFAWVKISGPSGGNILNPNSDITSVTGLTEGIYKFQLIVIDNNGSSSTASVTITVKAAPLPPVANAGNAQTVTLPDNSVNLNGNASTAPSGSISDYLWSKKSGPSGASITSSGSVITSVTGLSEGVYIFELEVTDNNGLSSTASVTITVKAAPLPPVANAGSAQTITLPDNSVNLNGSASTAPSGSISDYLWSKKSGPSGASITSSGSVITSVTGLSEGVYIFELKVTDNNGLSSTASVTITVKAAPLPPVANAGSAQTITLPDNSANLNGSASTAPSGSIGDYLWSKKSGPSGASITSPGSVITSVTGLSEGVYIFELKVTDNNGLSSTASVTITVKAAPLPPVANAGSAQTITLPDNSVNIDGSGSYATSGSNLVGYNWVKISGPIEGIITDDTNISTTVTGLIEGVYEFQLEVTDDKGSKATSMVSVTVNAAPIPPVADAGNDQTITLPVNSVSLNGSKSVAPGSIIVSYEWTKVSGPSGGSISDPSQKIAIINSLLEGKYQFQLKITDDRGMVAFATVFITVNPAPLPPVANAGNTQTITLPVNSVTLNGSQSTARSGQLRSFSWSKLSGPNAGIISSTNNSVTSVSQLIAGTYIFQLTVIDDNGNSATATVTVIVNPVPFVPPVANAGEDMSVQLPLNQIVMDGSKSYARNGGVIKSYKWEKTSGPDALIILNSNSATPVIQNVKPGIYLFTLSVEDANGFTNTDEVKITVMDAAVVLPPPVANAGESRIISFNDEEIFLDGGMSYAQFGNIEKYNWVMISGPSSVIIDNAESDLAIVSGMVVGEYVYELTVTDNIGKTNKATVKITVVNTNTKPDLSPVIKVFPNPVTRIASIELQGPAKGRTAISIFDTHGKRVYKTEFVKDDLYVNHQLNIHSLVKGIYFVEVIIDYRYRSVMKIIKL